MNYKKVVPGEVFCPAPDEEGFTSHALPAAESVWQTEYETK